MQPEESKAVVRKFLEDIFEGGDLELIEELFAPDYVLHDPALPEEVRGPEGMRRYVSMYRGAYPDTGFTIEDQISDGDEVVTRWTGQGTHEGELMGIPPTGKRVTVTLIDINRIESGKLVERWGQADMLGMMRQLGVAPPSDRAAH